VHNNVGLHTGKFTKNIIHNVYTAIDFADQSGNYDVCRN